VTFRGWGVLAVSLLASLLLPAAAASAREGDLDPSFGSGGIVTTAIRTNLDRIHALALDGAGRIVAAGDTTVSSDDRFALVRYQPSGAPDPMFGAGGIVTTPIGTSATASALALDAAGRIVVAGTSDGHIAVARYDSGGGLDVAGFGTGGIVNTTIGTHDEANAVAIDPGGRIVVAGRTQTGTFTSNLLVVRYLENGTPDTSFGQAGTGVASTPVPSEPFAGVNSMAIDPAGRIVVAGFGRAGSVTEVVLARYEPNGTLDETFGDGGTVVTPIGSGGNAGAQSIAIDALGRIVVAGSASNAPDSDFALARYNPDGTLDSSFGSGGVVMTQVAGANDGANAMAFDQQGRIVAGGYATVNGGFTDFAVARYNADGSLDTSFADGGKRLTQIGSTNAYASGLLIDGQDRIVAGGYEQIGTTKEDFALARYFGDQTPPPVEIDSGPADNSFTKDSTPTFTFKSSDPTVAAFQCGLDGLLTACGSPFTTSPLRDGSHTFSVVGTDAAGNASAAATRRFTVDTVRPALTIRGKSKLATRKRKASALFRIKASEPLNKLTCKLDRRKAKPCKSRYRTPKLKPSKHVHRLKVTATDRAGNRTTKTKKFRIVPKR
jgi:uncharacterized delta-60 repeat protein